MSRLTAKLTAFFYLKVHSFSETDKLNYIGIPDDGS